MSAALRIPTWSVLGRAALAALLAAATGGCGYTLVGTAAVPADVTTIHVRVEAPERSDPLLADSLAREVRRVLRWGGRFRPVEDGHADAELVLRITTDRLRAVAFDKYDEVLDYQVTVAVDAELKRSGQALIWSAQRISATRGQAAVPGAVVTSSSAFQGGDIVTSQSLGQFDTEQLGEERKTAAREAVMKDLAETVYARMTEGI